MKRKLVYKIVSAVTIACMMAATMAGCGSESGEGYVKDTLVENGNSSSAGEAESAAAVNLVVKEELFTDRDLSGEYSEAESAKITLTGNSAQSDSGNVKISGNTITITRKGTYILSGTLKDGMIVVEADDAAKVQLVLDGAEISNSTGAAIYIKSGDKIFVTTAPGSRNKLVNGGSYTVLDDNNIDSVIFSKSDLVLNGSGSLEILAEAGHGIVSKDDLKITGGDISVEAEAHGVSGKDSVRIAEGTLNIVSGKDGIHSDNDEDTEKGYVYIAGGSFSITSGGDGIAASLFIQVDDGTFAITAGGGNANKTTAKDENGDTLSTKGIKASGDVVLNNGTFTIDAQDDALHSNTNLTVNGGKYQLSSGDDGIHADATTTVAGGSLEIATSYEGIEGYDIVISGGYTKLYASDDGINAAGGNDQSGFGGMFGMDGFGGRGGGGFGEATDSSVQILGGTIYMDADGDGIDSNGELIVTGGEVYISGPENGANGAFDYASTAQAAGGTVVAVGGMQMAMNFDSSSTQGSILISTSNQSAGTEIVVKDSNGKELVSYTAESSFNSVLVSSPEMVQGGTYTISVGGSDTEITLDSLIYGSGNGMGGFGGGGMGGFGGMGGGRGGRGDWNIQNQDGQTGGTVPEMPDMGEMPEMPNGEMPEMPSGEMPDMGEMPSGTMPGGQMPGGQMPGGGQRPGGMPGDSRQNQDESSGSKSGSV